MVKKTVYGQVFVTPNKDQLPSFPQDSRWKTLRRFSFRLLLDVPNPVEVIGSYISNIVRFNGGDQSPFAGQALIVQVTAKPVMGCVYVQKILVTTDIAGVGQPVYTLQTDDRWMQIFGPHDDWRVDVVNALPEFLTSRER